MRLEYIGLVTWRRCLGSRTKKLFAYGDKKDLRYYATSEDNFGRSGAYWSLWSFVTDDIDDS